MKETQHIEWKESWRDDYLRWICGFANAGGGTLIIGRNDKGQVVGVKDARRLLEEIPNKVRDILGVMVDVNLCKESGNEFIEIVVGPYSNPISYKGEYYYRSGRTNQTLKGAALERFLLRKQGRHWDAVPVALVKMSDLETRTIAYFRKQALKSRRLPAEILNEEDQPLLEKLHLFAGNHLKHAAVLLFHPDPERYITGAYVKIGYFESNVDLRYQDEVHGDLFSQVNQIIEILKAKYLKAWISYDGLQRVETLPLPEPALREAILNAVVHKDYSSGIPTQISVYSDKLMIWNPGQLPHDWSVEQLLGKHASQPFNPDIANVFFRAGMIEAWGRGIECIMEVCSAARLPKPQLRCESTGFWLVFAFALEQKEPDDISAGLGERLGERLGEKLGETRTAIIEAMLENPRITVVQLAAKLHISTTSVENNLQYLKKLGHIGRVGPARGGYWTVKGNA